MTDQEKINQPILFYDGNCGFCNRSVQFILTQEKSAQIHFSPLQSAFALKVLKSTSFDASDLTTIYFKQKELIFSQSSAAFAILPYLKWYWQPLHFFRIFPKSWRDLLYAYISKKRTKLASSFCLIPTEAQSNRFIK